MGGACVEGVAVGEAVDMGRIDWGRGWLDWGGACLGRYWGGYTGRNTGGILRGILARVWTRQVQFDGAMKDDRGAREVGRHARMGGS